MSYVDYRSFKNPDPNVGTYNIQTHKIVAKKGRWKRILAPIFVVAFIFFWLGWKLDTNRFKDTIFDKEKKIERHLTTIAEQNKIIDSLEAVIDRNLEKIDVLDRQVKLVNKEKVAALKEIDKYKEEDVDRYLADNYNSEHNSIADAKKLIVTDLVECDYIKRELNLCNEKLILFDRTTVSLQNQVDLSTENVELSGNLWSDIETDLRKREGRVNRYQAKRQKRALGNAFVGGVVGFIVGSQIAK